MTTGFVYAFAEDGDMDQNYSIIIDSEYELSALPKGVVGKTYPVFSAKAVNTQGKEVAPVSILAFYDANGDTYKGMVEDDQLLNIANGCIETSKEGVYVVEYSAMYNAEVKIERVFIDVLANYTECGYEINPSIGNTGITGEKVYIPEGKLSCDKSFGEIVLEIEIEYQGQYTCGKVEYVNFGKPYFIPKVSGDYIIKYFAYNFFGEKALLAQKVVTIVDADTPVLTKPTIPAILNLNQEIVFPSVEAVQYLDGKIYYLPIEIYFDGEQVENNTFTPTKTGQHVISYIARSITNDNVATRYDFDVTVNDLSVVKDSVFDNYFNLDNFTVGFESGIYTFTTVADGSASWDFYTKLPVDLASVQFNLYSQDKGFTDVEITFVDSAVASESITIKLEESKYVDNCIDMYLNGEKVYTISNKSIYSGSQGFVLSYDNARASIVDEKNQTLCTIKYYEDGNQFVGFSSGKVYVSAKLNGITSTSKMGVVALAGETIVFSKVDTRKPTKASSKGFSFQEVEYGDTITLLKPECFDLLDDNPKVLIRLVSPNGTTILNDVEMTEDYIFKADIVGNYAVYYSFVDRAGNNQKGKIPVRIFVIDRYSPEVVSSPDFSETVRVGTVLTLPSAQFSDNVTASSSLTTWIYVQYGNYQKQLIKNGKYTFSKAGKYIIKYGAMDAAGNITVIEYRITCK